MFVGIRQGPVPTFYPLREYILPQRHGDTENTI